MSFEFERPTCFSPNGLVFGVLRENHAYSAPCRTYAGGPFDNTIRWYFVPDDAPLYEGVSAFEPRVDEMFDRNNDTFEKAGFGLKPRKHTRGLDIWHRDATGVIGTADDFAGRTLADDCKCRQGPPHPPCVSGPHAFNEFGLGQRAHIPGPSKNLGRLKLGSLFSRPADLYARGWLALGGVFYQVTEPIFFVKRGFGLGAVMSYTPAVAVNVGAGLALGAVMSYTPAVAVNVGAGLALGAVMSYTPAVAVHLGTGLALGAVMTYTPAVAVHLGTGLALGATFVATAATTIHKTQGIALGTHTADLSNKTVTKQGLALGAVLTVVEDETPGGGASCAESRLISLGVEYPSTYETMADQWYKFPVLDGFSYHVSLTAVGGSNFSADVYLGTSCAGLNYLDTLSSIHLCVEAGNDLGEDAFIFIQAFSSGGTVDATIQAGTGGCP